MGYRAVHETVTAPRSSGDLLGLIEVGFAVRAWVRIQAVANSDDQREIRIIQQVFSGNVPTFWLLLVVARLDAAGKLASPADSDVDFAIAAVWDRLVKAG